MRARVQSATKTATGTVGCYEEGGWTVAQDIYILHVTQSARVAELADAPDLGSGGETRGGSSPPFRTNNLYGIVGFAFLDCA